MLQNIILKEIQFLPEFAQKEVLDYMLFLKDKHLKKKVISIEKRPFFGCGKINIKMADDFDAPLDDFKEYM